MTADHKKLIILSVTWSALFSLIVGGSAGFLAGRANFYLTNASLVKASVKVVDEQSAVIDAVQKVSPAVVSVIITKNVPVIQQNTDAYLPEYYRQFFNLPSPKPSTNSTASSTLQQIGGGSGFIITTDGYIVTNRHVVDDPTAEYTVLTNDDQKYQAKVLAEDTVYDFAIIKIEATNLPTVEFGDSASLKVGQRVIAIGNSLGEFGNSVSTGVVSGLYRSITAGSDTGGSEQLVGVIQTDASINPGNSGGPLLNTLGQVVGINVAVAQGAQGIGFALPINEIKNSIESFKSLGRIVHPYLGVRYLQINQEYATANKLPVDYGAEIVQGASATDPAILAGSPAEKAGLKVNDIILEINGQKIDFSSPLINVISNYKVGDTISLLVLSQGVQKEVKVTLEELR